MSTKGYFAHTSPEGITPWYWFTQAGYHFVFAGENLAIDFTESQDVENAWLNSPAHRANILDSRFTEIGIAVKDGIYQGQPTTYVVQMFGKPVISDTTETVIPQKAPIVQTPAPKPAPEKVAITPPVSPIKNVEGATSAVPNVAVVKETPNAIVVENTDVNSSGQSAATENSTNYASPLDTALVKSPTYAHYALIAIAGVLILGLILFIFIEIKRQHPRHIFLGIVSLVIVLALAYATKAYFLLPF